MSVGMCPVCGGHVVTVKRRAWCLRPYREGGCGHWWRYVGAFPGGRWVLQDAAWSRAWASQWPGSHYYGGST